MWSDEDEGIDKAIDQVARGLTRGAPGGAFKARVLGQLEERGRAKAAWPRRLVWRPLAVAVAVAAIALIAVRGAWRSQPVPVRSGPAVAAAPVSTPLRPPVRMHAEPPATRTAAVAPTHRPVPARRQPAGESAIDALAPDPLIVEPIAVDALSGAVSIQLSEMRVTSIDVAPLPADSRQE
jgi:hypothetical protein